MCIRDSISPHGTVIAVAEVVAVVSGSLIERSIIIKVVLGVKSVRIIVISPYSQALGILVFIDELQSVNHTAVIAERILLAFDGLELTGVQIAAAVCVVPVVLIIIVFLFIQVFSRNYLEPTLAYTGTILNTVSYTHLDVYKRQPQYIISFPLYFSNLRTYKKAGNSLNSLIFY